MAESSVNFRLDGEIALVTGAARGIGAAVARALAEAGAAVMVTDVSEDAGKATAAAIAAAGGRAGFVRHDVTDEAEWRAAVARTVEAFGGLTCVVNNAGIETASLIADCDLADFRRVMAVNVDGVFLGVREAVRAMRPGGAAGRGGSIINLSSVAGLIGTPAHIAYHTSKGAVRLMTKAAAIECAALKYGIRVNSVHPAIVQTDMGESFVKDFVDLGLSPDMETARAAFLAATPMGCFGHVSDIAGAVVYLASPAARWVTGAEMVLDGGYTAA